jgi:ABC-type Fe3+-hydroxamate transport system substrate-binding protein
MNHASSRAVLALLALAACQSRHEPARTDASSGHTATRIVSLDPGLTSLVAALGAAPRLVGRTRHCALPPDVDAPVVGDLRPVPELVLGATPDLVLMADYPSQAADRAALEALGAPVLALPLVTLENLRTATDSLGRRLGLAARATQLNAAMEAALQRTSDCAARLGPPGRAPTVAIIHALDGGFAYTTGGGDHIDGLLARAGLVNALAGHPRTARLGLEVIVAAHPDVILHTAPDPALPDSASALALWRRFPEVPAVGTGRVRVWPDDRLARNGPHLTDVAARLCAFLAGGGR